LGALVYLWFGRVSSSFNWVWVSADLLLPGLMTKGNVMEYLFNTRKKKGGPFTPWLPDFSSVAWKFYS
jgi:hypothetical protein